MLTHDQVVDLLTAISAYDNRKANPASVLAWGKAAELGRWTLPEALDAVHQHFLEETDYLMPAHIGNRIRATRQDRTLREEAAIAIELASPAHPRVLEMADQLARRLAIPEQYRPSGHPERQVECPHCGASVGQPCTRPSHGGSVECGPHPSRVELASESEAS